MPTVQVDVTVPIDHSGSGAGSEVRNWLEDVAPGETLGRMLSRVVVIRPVLARVYDSTTRRLSPSVSLLVNGRAYHLVGGLTYTLHDGDQVTVAEPDTGEAR